MLDGSDDIAGFQGECRVSKNFGLCRSRTKGMSGVRGLGFWGFTLHRAWPRLVSGPVIIALVPVLDALGLECRVYPKPQRPQTPKPKTLENPKP